MEDLAEGVARFGLFKGQSRGSEIALHNPCGDGIGVADISGFRVPEEAKGA